MDSILGLTQLNDVSLGSFLRSVDGPPATPRRSDAQEPVFAFLRSPSRVASDAGAGSASPVEAPAAAWTQEESDLLILAIDRFLARPSEGHLKRPWARIAEVVETRGARPCRAQYRILLQQAGIPHPGSMDDAQAAAALVLSHTREAGRRVLQDACAREEERPAGEEKKRCRRSVSSSGVPTTGKRQRTSPVKIEVQLLPASREFADAISKSGNNPKVLLTVRPTKTLAEIASHLDYKWKSVTQSDTWNGVRVVSMLAASADATTTVRELAGSSAQPPRLLYHLLPSPRKTPKKALPAALLPVVSPCRQRDVLPEPGEMPVEWPGLRVVPTLTLTQDASLLKSFAATFGTNSRQMLPGADSIFGDAVLSRPVDAGKVQIPPPQISSIESVQGSEDALDGFEKTDSTPTRTPPTTRAFANIFALVDN